MNFDPWKQVKINAGIEKIKNSIDVTRDLEIEDLKKLCGIQSSHGDGANMSITANEKARIQREKNIRPGTPEWFKLWFSLPYMTGESPYDK